MVGNDIGNATKLLHLLPRASFRRIYQKDSSAVIDDCTFLITNQGNSNTMPDSPNVNRKQIEYW